jgi:hypothetical protein
LALEHIRKGIIGREALLDALHTDVLETGASVTRAQTRDALSGYGVFRPLDKAADKAKLRDIQAEAQKLAQLEALQKGKAPLATGFERQGPNDETRKLTKQVNEAKKAAGIAQIDDASRLKSALGAAKTRIRNAIADLRTEIDTGERMVRGKSVLISDTGHVARGVGRAPETGDGGIRRQDAHRRTAPPTCHGHRQAHGGPVGDAGGEGPKRCL